MRHFVLGLLAALVVTSSARAGELLWQEDFNATALSAAWIVREGCPAEASAEDWLCYSQANVWVADGKLHLRQTPGLERPYDGAMISTYRHGYGWPAKDVRQAWKPPFVVEARIRFSGADGFWQTFSANSVDLPAPTLEFDIAEMRGAKESYQFCALHQRPRHTRLGTSLPFNFATQYRRWWMYVTDSAVRYGVGMNVCGTTAIPNPGRIGIDFVAKSADPLRWRWAGIGGPLLDTAGYDVDWVRASRP